MMLRTYGFMHRRRILSSTSLRFLTFHTACVRRSFCLRRSFRGCPLLAQSGHAERHSAMRCGFRFGRCSQSSPIFEICSCDPRDRHWQSPTHFIHRAELSRIGSGRKRSQTEPGGFSFCLRRTHSAVLYFFDQFIARKTFQTARSANHREANISRPKRTRCCPGAAPNTSNVKRSKIVRRF